MRFGVSEDSLDNSYFDRLPLDTQELVEEIETAVNFEIDIEVREPEEKARRRCRSPLKCEVDLQGARIITPAADRFPDSSVFHELLHIRRFLVEKVPRLTFCENYDPWSPELESALTSLDNGIEHLIIVPQELARKPERKTYWVEVMRRVLSELRTNTLYIDDRERLTLRDIMFVTTVLKDPQLAADFGGLVEKLDLSERANALSGVVGTALHSKEQLAKAFVTQLHIPFEPVCLEYIDATNGKSHEINISQVE